MTGGGPTGGAVTLRPVDEEALDRLVQAAVTDARPDEVTPPRGPDGGWTAERVEWLRSHHRRARSGLDGPAGQATFAVVLDEEVVGAVRLARTDEPDVLETGIWLTHGARGRGVGRRALVLLVPVAAAHGAAELRARTTRGNAAALAVLRALGFACDVAEDRVTAVLPIADGGAALPG